MQLIDEARHFWRWGSVRVMAVPPLLAGLYAANPAMFNGLTEYVPEHWRPLALFVLTMIFTGSGILARVITKSPKDPANG